MFRTLILVNLITYGHSFFRFDLLKKKHYSLPPLPPLPSIISIRLLSHPKLHSISCPIDERFVLCVGCENTCANPDVAILCDGTCSPGCVCREGWFRNRNGVCVPPENCDSCGPNEVFSACGADNCVSTCEQPDLNTICRPIRCIAGCICKNGLVRNRDSACVDPRACKLECKRNEVINSCGDNCRLTCANRNESLECPVNCGPPACSCKPEFVRGPDNECILPSQCPICPGPDEFFTCGSACQTTCDTLGEPCNITTPNCVEGCFCRNGFARDKRGVCIPEENCPPMQCPTDPNAIVSLCGDPCPLTCENKNDYPRKPCSVVGIENTCKCKEGFVLGKNKKCIPSQKCPPRQCPTDRNAVVLPCGDPCPVTCENLHDINRPPCAEFCIVKGCKCKIGFVLGKNGKCVPTNLCNRLPYKHF